MCVYVQRQAARTYTTYHPEIWRGLLISPGLGTKPRGNPKCWPTALPMAPPTARPHPAHFCSLVLRSICTGLFNNCIVKQSQAALGSPHLFSINISFYQVFLIRSVMFRKLVVQIEGRRSVSNLNICFPLVATPLMNYD